ncbi:MAG: class III poly(R)-hydroxyalkanoic acid synthase subunit PhaE, partial [Luteimonas sp.]|nr:class III poly(R)-hydroxyalkanoic acid synthase subunit PhaE [Luteimonas sp.]
MLNHGLGGIPGSTDDFERLARQYWGAWGDSMRGSLAGGGQPGMHAWQEAIDWWTRYAHGGREGMNDVLERFNAQARDWYGRMQQVAAQFAGRDNSARDVAAAWKQALGAAGVTPFPELFRSMRGHGLRGLDQWIDDASPWLDAIRSEGMSWLKLPAFGFAREHQERLQSLAQAMAEYQECNSAYGALMAKASQSAFEIFEDKLVAHEEPGRQIESPRALFDLWIDAAEEAYADIALSKEFREVYGKLVDAQMRLRAGVQREVEQASALFGMPTRTEVDAAHRKIVELERALRRMRDATQAAPPRTADRPPPAAS